MLLYRTTLNNNSSILCLNFLNLRKLDYSCSAAAKPRICTAYILLFIIGKQAYTMCAQTYIRKNLDLHEVNNKLCNSNYLTPNIFVASCHFDFDDFITSRHVTLQFEIYFFSPSSPALPPLPDVFKPLLPPPSTTVVVRPRLNF